MFELSAIQKQLQATAREFAKKEIAPRAAEVDRSENYPWKNVELLTNQGFMGMTIPKEYGGKGMTYLLGNLRRFLVIAEVRGGLTQGL